MNWLYYLAEANAYLCVFYLAYCLLFTKETYYQLSRAYLLFSCVAAFALPVLQLGSLKPAEIAQPASVSYVVPATPVEYTTSAVTAPVIVGPAITWTDYLWYAYITGAAVLLLVLIVKLFTLYKLISNKQRVAQDGHKVVYLPESDVAFSFFNYLFIGTNARGANTIIRHELVHINQKHSLDILFLELLKIISWFNPCIYLLQNSLKTIHEYIADEQTAAQEADALSYSSFLVNNAYGAGGSSLTHSFFNYNLLKKRIIMLNQKRSGNLARLKYLLPLPLCAALLCASTLGFSKNYGWVDLAPAAPVNAVRTVEDPQKVDNFKYKTSSKGYKYREEGFVLTSESETMPSKVNYRVTILENGKPLVYYKNKATATEVKLLKDKYGYEFPDMPIYSAFPPPKPKVDQVKFPSPVVKTTPPAPKITVVKFPPPVVKAAPPKPEIEVVKFPPPIVKGINLDDFYKEISRSVKYPKVDKDNFITGKVFAIFMVDEDHKINFVKVLRTPSNALGEEVIRVIKIAANTDHFKPGQTYTLPVEFSIDMDDSSEAVHAAQPSPQEKAAELVYNPKSINVPTEGGLVLNMIVIRGYATQR